MHQNMSMVQDKYDILTYESLTYDNLEDLMLICNGDYILLRSHRSNADLRSQI